LAQRGQQAAAGALQALVAAAVLALQAHVVGNNTSINQLQGRLSQRLFHVYPTPVGSVRRARHLTLPPSPPPTCVMTSAFSVSLPASASSWCSLTSKTAW
jgi:hypothetical protein